MKTSWDGNTPGCDGLSHCLTAQAQVTLCMLIKSFGFFPPKHFHQEYPNRNAQHQPEVSGSAVRISF